MKSPAFTLIEILVAISIVALVLGFGFAGFRQYSQRQVLFAVARGVKSDLRSLQQKALSGEKSPAVIAPCAGKFLDGYRFDIVSTTLYRMSAMCSGVEVVIEDKSLDSGFTISASIDPILFKVLGQGTSIPSGNSVVRITQTATLKYIEISVSAEGSIK